MGFTAARRGLLTVQERAYLVPEVMHALRVVLGVQDERNLPTPATTPHASLRRLAAEEEKKKDGHKDGAAAVGTARANADGGGSPHQLHIHSETGDGSDDVLRGSLGMSDDNSSAGDRPRRRGRARRHRVRGHGRGRRQGAQQGAQGQQPEVWRGCR